MFTFFPIFYIEQKPSSSFVAKFVNMFSRMRGPNSLALPLGRLLTDVLKLLHHLAQIGPNLDSDQTPKSFLQKEADLNKYFHPAMQNNHINHLLKRDIKTFFQHIKMSFRGHYKHQLLHLLQKIGDLCPSRTVLQEASRLAVTSAKRKLGKKLTEESLQRFHSLLSHIHDLKSMYDLQCFLHDHYPLTSIPPSKPGEVRPLMDIPTRPPPHYRTPHQQYPSCRKRPTLRDFIQPKKSAKPRPPPSSRPPATTHNRFQALQDDHQDPPHIPPLMDLHTSQPDGPSTVPPTTVPPHSFQPPDVPFVALFNPDLPPINVQGADHPLSNFFPAKLNYSATEFPSSEHAYQTLQAAFCGEMRLAEHAMSAPTANDSKQMVRQGLFQHPQKPLWDAEKEAVMGDILMEKAKQVPLFRDSLISTGYHRLTHNVPDEFWGSTYKNAAGKTLRGKDIFSKLLMQVRKLIQPIPRDQLPVSPQPNITQTSRTNRATSPDAASNEPSVIRSSTPTDEVDPPPPHRYSPISASIPSDDSLSSLLKNTTTEGPPDPHRSSTTTPKQLNLAADQSVLSAPPASPISGHRTHVILKDQPLPRTTSTHVIVGDTNVRTITRAPSNLPEIETFSATNATLFSFARHTLSGLPDYTPRIVILYIGTHNTKDMTGRHCVELIKRLSGAATRKFPRARIYISELNASESPANCDLINNTLIHKPAKLLVLPGLPPQDFQTTDGAMWTTQTANRLLQHWTAHLN